MKKPINESDEFKILEAKPINPMDEDKKIHQTDKQKQMEYYQANRESLIINEVKRLKRKNNFAIVSNYDCGPCAHCRKRKNCNDKMEENCRTRLRRIFEQEQKQKEEVGE